MEKIRRARYTLEFKLEALRLIGAGQRSFENWGREPSDFSLVGNSDMPFMDLVSPSQTKSNIGDNTPQISGVFDE